MNNAKKVLESILGMAPADLVAFYEVGKLPNYPESRINFLSLSDAQGYNRKVRSVEVITRLGLWFLDDANDSNPFAYITRGPCAGLIIHFSHDLPEIAFLSLKNLLETSHAAGEAELDIDEMKRDSIHLPLEEEIMALAAEESDDAQFLIGQYLKKAQPISETCAKVLLDHDNFFVREDLAEHIAESPKEEYRKIAEALSLDRHPQVANSGKKALSRIRPASSRP